MKNNEKKYPWQICQDEYLNQKFCELHQTLVNQIAAFCNEHNIEIDEVHMGIDGLRDSIMFGEWTAATDSSLTMYRFDEEHPYRQNLADVEPFLCNM